MYDLEVTGIHSAPVPGAQEGPSYVGQPKVDFTFDDFLDIINPLQHIPIVANIYRAITGDEISPHARIAGDTIFGGPSGFVSAIANVFYEEVAGEDVGETVLAFLTGDDGDADAQFAENSDEVAPAGAQASESPLADPLASDPMAEPLVTAAAPAALAAQPEGPATPSHGEPSDANAEAVLPEAGPGMLIGQDALNALFMDLRGGRKAAEPMALAAKEDKAIPLPDRQGAPAKSYPLPPRPARVAAARSAAAQASAAEAQTQAQAAAAGATAAGNPLLFAQEAGPGSVADRMMQALDKYEAMTQQRQAAKNGTQKDEDRPAWQTDPVLAPDAGS